MPLEFSRSLEQRQCRTSGNGVKSYMTLEDDLNSLQLTRTWEDSRDEKGSCGFQSYTESGVTLHRLKAYVNNLQQERKESEAAGRSNEYESVIGKVSIIIQNNKKGCVKKWKVCMRDKFHKHDCPKCPYANFVKCAKAQGKEIFSLVNYIRNKLTHFEEDKEEYGDGWMATRGDILNFVAAAFPELLPGMYNAMMVISKE